MKSIQSRLLLLLAVGLLCLVLGGGVLLYHVVQRALRDGFDAALVTQARALGSRLELVIDPEARPEAMRLGALVLAGQEVGRPDEDARAMLVDLAERSFHVHLPEVQSERRAGAGFERVACYQVWSAAGTLLFRSATPSACDLERPALLDGDVVFAEGALPDGRPSRLVTVRVADVPFHEPTWRRVWPLVRGVDPLDVHGAIVTVAEDRERLTAVLGGLRWALALGGLLIVVGGAELARRVVRRGLAPLRMLRRQIESLDAGTLDQRIRLASTPAELGAVVTSLNGALDALEAAFDRERRTTASIAHELRTPIAELRSLTEVARQWPDDEALQTQCVEEGHAVALHMGRVVSALLKVARAESGDEALVWESVRVLPLVRDAWDRLSAEARARHQVLAVDGLEDLAFESDRETAQTLLSSLLHNAIQHAPEGSTVRVDGRRDGTRTTVSCSNPCVDLQPEDLAHLSEPFWRKDAARSASVQGGLGLPLAAALARAVGIELALHLEGAVFAVRLTLPTARPPTTSATVPSTSHAAMTRGGRDCNLDAR